MLISGEKNADVKRTQGVCHLIHTLYSKGPSDPSAEFYACFAVVILLGMIVLDTYCCLLPFFVLGPIDCMVFLSLFLDTTKISVSMDSFFIKVDPEVFCLQSVFLTSDVNDFKSRVNYYL